MCAGARFRKAGGYEEAVKLVRSGEIRNRLSGEMGYTYGHDALDECNPHGRSYP